MIPDKFNVDLEPVEVRLALTRETMLFLGLVSLAGLVYGYKRLSK